jgi:hypothetical protein
MTKQVNNANQELKLAFKAQTGLIFTTEGAVCGRNITLVGNVKKNQ